MTVIALLSLLLVVAMILGFIVVIVVVSANSRRALVLIASVLGVFGLLLFALTFFIYEARSVSRSQSVRYNINPEVQYNEVSQEVSSGWGDATISTPGSPPLAWSDPQETLIGGGSAWLSVVEDVHDPVVFASADDAAAALGRKTALLVKNSVLESENAAPLKLYVAPMQHPGRDELVASLVQSLTEQARGLQVNLVDSPDELKDDAVTVRISMTITDKRTAPWSLRRTRSGSRQSTSYGPERHEQPQYEQLSGKLRAEVRWPEDEKKLTTSFVDKPWVKNYAEFVSIRGGRHWLLARSGDLTTNQVEAKSQAIRAAARWMAPSIRAQAIQLSGGPRRVFQVQSQNAIAEELRLAMENHGKYIVDEFAQELKTSEGYVWRDAILLDFSPDDFDNRAILAVNAGRRVQVRNASAMASIVGLIILIATVYVFLNAATKGYYTWSLRGAALVLLVIGGTVLLMMIAIA